MSERYDYIAINKLGAYAICEDLPGDPEGLRQTHCAGGCQG